MVSHICILAYTLQYLGKPVLATPVSHLLSPTTYPIYVYCSLYITAGYNITYLKDFLYVIDTLDTSQDAIIRHTKGYLVSLSLTPHP